MVIVGLIEDTAQIPQTTDQRLHTKGNFFPQKCQSPRFLDHILIRGERSPNLDIWPRNVAYAIPSIYGEQLPRTTPS
ncbi:MAG: hypothetical protein ACYCYK_09550 [Candidatus Dormibacteria bacterium]